ncbi:hypothetical protein [Streptomyces lydicus]|uniref:hypothetical protein n=1 Tax=Streptomyces lydicus TaxID=47763 RepID=UPI0036ECC6E2
MNRRIVTVMLVGVSALSLSACDSGPECLDYTTQVVPHTTFINGKAVFGTSLVTTCVKYAEPKAGKGE